MFDTMTIGAPAFETLVQRHHRELHVHCYRMLASFGEADEAVQETFLRRDDRDGVPGRAAGAAAPTARSAE